MDGWMDGHGGEMRNGVWFGQLCVHGSVYAPKIPDNISSNF